FYAMMMDKTKGSRMKKQNKEKVEIKEGREYVGKTIVGGRPLRRPKRILSIPVGIEKVLYKAAVDPAFKKLLVADRMKAVESESMGLSPSEVLIFRNVSDSALRTMIGRIRPKKHGRRKLMKAVAAAVVTLATGTASISCDEGLGTSDGISPDVPMDYSDIDVAGDMADIPDDLNDTLDVPDDGMDVVGDTADIPPDVADEPDGEEADGEEMDGEDLVEDTNGDADAGDAQEDPAGDDGVDEDAAGDAGDAGEDLSDDPAEEG
ncbi:MAG: hypothetical protein ABIJ56_01820, partial [Pseudomonadota bacterium]